MTDWNTEKVSFFEMNRAQRGQKGFACVKSGGYSSRARLMGILATYLGSCWLWCE